MRKKKLRELFGRVETWPKEAQQAAFDSLTAIEQESYINSVLAEDLIRSRDDVRASGKVYDF